MDVGGGRRLLSGEQGTRTVCLLPLVVFFFFCGLVCIYVPQLVSVVFLTYWYCHAPYPVLFCFLLIGISFRYIQPGVGVAVSVGVGVGVGVFGCCRCWCWCWIGIGVGVDVVSVSVLVLDSFNASGCTF